MLDGKQVQTVLGAIPVGRMGVTLPHEHMFLDLRQPKLEQEDPAILERLAVAQMDDLEGVIRDLRNLRESGGSTVVELTTSGMSRSDEYLVEAATASGVNVVCATGFYAQEFHEEFVFAESESQLSDRMLIELNCGIDGTEVRAGVIKLGSSCFPLTGNELKCFRAGAHAQLQTGVAITTHTSAKVAQALASGTMGFEQLDVLESVGVDPNRVIIGHVDTHPNLQSHLELARRGAYVEIDGIGSGRHCSDDDRVRMVANLYEHGLGHRVLLSHDLARVTSFRARGGGGYGYLLREFVPLLKTVGIGEREVNQMLVSNPATAFGVPSSAS